LPEQLARGDRAWLSMPLAQPVREALAGEALGAVVRAVASFAATLSDLQQRHGIAHRDVKPGNLYRYGDAWAVGDLGLIGLPGADALTAPDRIVGPANFVAYEMMVSSTAADAHLGDVYSLAKTLWVLATDQLWPPPGHQPAADALQSIGAYRHHERVADLDRLVDICTRRPNERPTLAGMAAELQAWLDAPTMPNEGDLDLGDVAARIRAQLAPERARQELEKQRLQAAEDDAQLLAELLEPLRQVVLEAAPNMERGPTDEVMPMLQPLRAIGEPQVLRQWPLGVHVAGPGTLPMMFNMAALVAALDDGQMQVGGVYLVKPERVMGSHFMEVYGPWRLQPGTAASRQALHSLAGQMTDGLGPALQAFADALQ